MRRLLLLPVLLVSVLALASIPASAQTTATDSIAAIVDEIESTGRFIDPGAEPLGNGVEAAIDRANAVGIAVAFPDPATNAEVFTPALDAAMAERSMRYDSILVLTPTMIAAEVVDIGDQELNQAFDAADAGFVRDGDAGAIDGFVASITGGDLPSTSAATDTTEAAADDSTDAALPADGAVPADGADNGGGFPWFWAIIAAVAGFFGIRYFTNKRKRQAAERAAVETDRKEIAEQLRNNADRVIDLGDPVIARKDAELIALYEEASRTYQEVSLALPEATTAAEIDALDDRIDRAEWQLEVIAARLAGEPVPPSPEERARAATPPATDGPALGPDDSIFGRQPGGGDARTRIPPPTPQRQPRPQPRSSGGGGIGGMLGSILGSILLGGGQPRTISRRTQRRTGSTPFGSSGRPSGSFPDPFSKTRRSSGRALGRSGSTRRRGSSRSAGGSRARNTTRRSAGGSRRR